LERICTGVPVGAAQNAIHAGGSPRQLRAIVAAPGPFNKD